MQSRDNDKHKGQKIGSGIVAKKTRSRQSLVGARHSKVTDTEVKPNYIVAKRAGVSLGSLMLAKHTDDV